VSGFAVLICSHGDQRWSDLARERAEPSAGGQGAMEIARAVKRATWLCFLDADDELEHGYLTAMTKAIAPRLLTGRADCTLFAPALSFVVAGVKTSPMIPNQGSWPRLNECVIGTLIHRDLFTEVGGFREFPMYEDWDLWLRCEKAGAEIVHVPDAIYLAHRSASGGGRNAVASADTYQRIWRDYAA
jgi:GT2 family glycosyltransferase